MAFPPQKRLSDTERMDRIGELLCEAVMLAQRQREVPVEDGYEENPEPPDSVLESGIPSAEENVLKQIEEFVGAHWRVSPSQIQARFALKRTTLHYKIKTLIEHGRIQKEGGGRSTKYKIKEKS